MPKGVRKEYKPLMENGTRKFFRRGKVKFTVTLDEQLFDDIKSMAHRNKQSFASMVADLLEWGMESTHDTEA